MQSVKGEVMQPGRRSSLFRRLVWLGAAAAWQAAAAAVFEPGGLALPRVAAPRLEQGPPVEARIDPGDWRGAARLFGFVDFKTGSQARFDTEVYLAHTAEALYAAFRCHAPAGSRPVASVRHRDGPVYRDDSIEFYLVPPGLTGRHEYYQFVVNPANTQLDLYGVGVELEWDGEWTSAAAVLDDGWLAVMRIPFATLGLDGPPEELRFAATRVALAPEAESSVLYWSGRKYHYNGPDRAATLVLGKDTPAVALERGSDFTGGDVVLSAEAVVLPPEGFTDSLLTVLDRSGGVVASDRQQQRFDSRRVVHELRDLPDGTYRLRYAFARAAEGEVPAYYGGGGTPAGEAGEALTLLEWPLAVDKQPGVNVDLRLRDRGATLWCRLQPRRLPAKDRDTEYRFAVLDAANGELCLELPVLPFEDEATVYEAALAGLDHRARYLLRVGVADGENILAEEHIPFATPPAPEWLGTGEGLPLEVPEPWIPVALDGRRVEVWGRTYTFNDGPAPSSIVSLGRELLARPARLALDPAPAGWVLENSRTEGPAGAPTAAILTWSVRGGTRGLRAVTRVEFDGVVRIDLTVPAGASVARLDFEAPVRREAARYVHRGPVRFGGFFTTYELPTDPDVQGYIPNYYLLDDRGGLCWFHGMPFDWPLADPARVVVMEPDDNVALLRVRYIDDPRIYDRDRTYTLGLQAMPARPMPETTPGHFSTRHYAYGYEDAEKHPAWFSTVEYRAAGHVNTGEGSVDIRLRPLFDPASHSEREPFFEISHGPSFRFTLAWEPGGKGIGLRLLDRWRTVGRIDTGIDPLPGEWIHATASWGPGGLHLFLDGKPFVDLAWTRGLFSERAMNIYAGGKAVQVDDLRLSSSQRAAANPLDPLRIELDTLLLDTFDTPGWVNGRRATIPERVDPEAEAGYLSPSARLVEGPRGLCVDALREPVPSVLEGYARLGAQQVMFHARQYTDEACAGLYIKEEDRFRKAVDAIQGLGMEVILYLNNSLSNWDRMWDAYADDMLIEPRGTPFIQSWIPDEKTYQACPYGEYIDYWFWRLGRLMDEYGIDGYFLDGRMYTTCMNKRHGCGIENFDGEFTAARDIWRGRINQWRMYNLIKARGGYAEQHKSAQWDAPTCFFWDCAWEGEQLMGQSRAGRKNLDIMPLTAMRAQMNGFPYGVPVRNEATAYAPFLPIELATYSYVHGSTVSSTYRMDELLVQSPYWQALQRFGATLHNFIGYWMDRPPARETPHELVKVSAHVRDGRALLIVANFDEDRERTEGEVLLDLAALGLRAPRARDAFSGEAVALAGGNRLPLSIRNFRQAWFILEDGPPEPE